MNKTIKFAVSMSAAEFKDLESLRRKIRTTRSQFIREAVRRWKAESESKEHAGVKEDPGRYKTPAAADLTEVEELHRRAIAAAGRFSSGITDLSQEHDRYLEAAYAGIMPEKPEDKKE